nr:hypothetical protein [Tanacetum cinerariifolium]
DDSDEEIYEAGEEMDEEEPTSTDNSPGASESESPSCSETFKPWTTTCYFGFDAVEDFKVCWLKIYCCWYKLKLLDNAANSRLRLLEESAAADDKMKK